jgi:hypothetical protein
VIVGAGPPFCEPGPAPGPAQPPVPPAVVDGADGSWSGAVGPSGAPSDEEEPVGVNVWAEDAVVSVAGTAGAASTPEALIERWAAGRTSADPLSAESAATIGAIGAGHSVAGLTVAGPAVAGLTVAAGGAVAASMAGAAHVVSLAGAVPVDPASGAVGQAGCTSPSTCVVTVPVSSTLVVTFVEVTPEDVVVTVLVVRVVTVPPPVADDVVVTVVTD